MRNATTVRAIHQSRGAKGLPLERVYRHLFNPEIYLQAYGKLYRNYGAMTKGVTGETVDGMNVGKIDEIVTALRGERWKWSPARRVEIPKANGKTRPLGIPTWSDKLVQEGIRTLLEPYYEQIFRKSSHGFRPDRGCHTALTSIQRTWKGTVWFIEGDIKGCFDNIDHSTLLEILAKKIHDGRIIQLISNLLRKGYKEKGVVHTSTCGTPQGGVLSPLLANIYLNELDEFVEDDLIPRYTKGEKRAGNPRYNKAFNDYAYARKRKDSKEAQRLWKTVMSTPTMDTRDPNYRRLRYIRYADDFLLGFAGPKEEAERIKGEIEDWLKTKLKLTLSQEKTLITHAESGKADFLGYEITTTRTNTALDTQGRRLGGVVSLHMPARVVGKIRREYSVGGKIVHKMDATNDSEYTILNRYQSILKGIYNYYCLATNVSRRMQDIKRVLEVSLMKTLAVKSKTSVNKTYRRLLVPTPGNRHLKLTVDRPGRLPLIATFGGFPLCRKKVGYQDIGEFNFNARWFREGTDRTEIVARLLADKCELCGQEAFLSAHHVRKLSDVDKPGRRPKSNGLRIMAARRRKSLMVCKSCHDGVHAGKYDGPSLRV